jgi:putative transposase
MPPRKQPTIPDELLDALLAGADPKSALDPNGLLDALKKAFAERALNAEMDHHLSAGEGDNSRNGYGWGAARFFETSGCGRLNRNRR